METRRKLGKAPSTTGAGRGTFRGQWAGAEKALIKNAAEKVGVGYSHFMATAALEAAVELLEGRDAEIARELIAKRRQKMRTPR